MLLWESVRRQFREWSLAHLILDTSAAGLITVLASYVYALPWPMVIAVMVLSLSTVTSGIVLARGALDKISGARDTRRQAIDQMLGELRTITGPTDLKLWTYAAANKIDAMYPETPAIGTNFREIYTSGGSQWHLRFDESKAEVLAYLEGLLARPEK